MHRWNYGLWSAEVFDTPWEIIIKNYRDHLNSKKFDTLKEYSEDFIYFVAKSVTEEEEKIFVLSYLFTFLSKIISQINKEVKKITDERKISLSEIRGIVNSQVNFALEFINERKELENVPENFRDRFLEKYDELLTDVITRIFKKLPLTKIQKDKLRTISYSIFTKNIFPDSCSGIVLSGFGEKENFPTSINMVIQGVVLGFVKYDILAISEVTHDNSAAIIAFAQKDVAHTFIEGISPDYQEMLIEFMKKIFRISENNY